MIMFHILEKINNVIIIILKEFFIKKLILQEPLHAGKHEHSQRSLSKIAPFSQFKGMHTVVVVDIVVVEVIVVVVVVVVVVGVIVEVVTVVVPHCPHKSGQ
jgi:hypothetical protein